MDLVSDKRTNGSINDSIGYWFGSVITRPSKGQFLLSVAQHRASLLSHRRQVRITGSLSDVLFKKAID
jgi:hypothetical protein